MGQSFKWRVISDSLSSKAFIMLQSFIHMKRQSSGVTSTSIKFLQVVGNNKLCRQNEKSTHALLQYCRHFFFPHEDNVSITSGLLQVVVRV